MEGISIKTKTFVTIGLVILALFEFVTAMYVYGRKGEKKSPKLALTMHRVGGYIFLVCWLWPMIVGADLLARLDRYELGWQFDGPRFYHAFLGVTVFVLLLLKISCIRFYTNFRTSARWLGIVITVAAIVTWVVSGAFWLFTMGGRTVPG